MSKNSPLLIQTKQGFGGVVASKLGEWSPIEGIEAFIDNILTNDIDIETQEEEISAIISGIPSPWARALVFKYALNFDPAQNPQPNGLMRYYESLQNEWKGLIGCVALHNDKITVRKIELAPSRQSTDADFEFYELKGALGRMLFEDASVWGDPLAVERGHPFLQAILFSTMNDNQPESVVIGATSPFSILFTPPKVKSTVPFCDKTNGRFISPLKVELTASQVQLLFDYVNYLKKQIHEFGGLINQGRAGHEEIGFDPIAEFLDRFLNEIREYAYETSIKTGQRYTINPDNIISTEPHFASPFNIILNAESKVYMDKDGLFFLNPKEGAQLVTLNNLLLDTSNALVEVGFNKDESPNRCAAYLLKAGNGYFALPFTPSGMRTFQNSLSDMVNVTRNDGSSISAEMTSLMHREVKVSLRLRVYKDEKSTAFIFVETTKVYQTRQILHERIVAWPDFLAEGIWNDYFLYSELPHSALEEVKAWPLLRAANGRIKEDATGNFAYACAKGTGAASEVLDSKIVVPQPAGQGKKLRYEIYQSTLPFSGIELRIGASDATKVGGYLIGKADQGDGVGFKIAPHKGKQTMSEVSVGFDFGSNNTCVSYQRAPEKPELVEFHNRRLVFLGSDNSDPENRLDARAYELMFFQKEQPVGKFRSLMMIHDDERLETHETDVKQVAMGGFPVFERNVPISRLDPSNREFNYLVDLNGEISKIKYNMKWAGVHLVRENGYKHSFIKSIWLMANAELLVRGFYPVRLSWAYPFAMSDELHTHYTAMWKVIGPVMNLGSGYDLKANDLTESEAVAEFVTSTKLGGMSPGNNELAIGFDVGGSTTDILMLVQKDRKDYLVRQSSLLMAAGLVTKTAQNSRSIRQSIRSFALDKANSVNIWGISESDIPDRLNADTAPFFLNTVFDRLNDHRVEQLYLHFYEHGSKEIFTLVAFITGLLLFYAGQLSAAIIQMEEYKDINSFKLGFFGKGGNIFNWIMTALNRDGRGERYFTDCFRQGLFVTLEEAASAAVTTSSGTDESMQQAAAVKKQIANMKLSSSFKTNYATNKAEVAYGLSTPPQISRPEDRHENRKDIIGEKGYKLHGNTLSATECVEPGYLQEIGGNFIIPDVFPNMEVFVGLFCDFIVRESPKSAELVKKELYNAGGLRKYIQELPQYIDASKTPAHFDFKASMIVLQGMYLLDEVILKHCVSQD